MGLNNDFFWKQGVCSILRRIFCIFLLVISWTVQPVFAAKIDGLNEAMMGSVLLGGVGDYDVKRSTYFSSEDADIIWFASFKGVVGAPNAKLSAEWIAPTGEVFKKQEFSTVYGNNRFGFTKLDLANVDKKALQMKGEWTVKVYWDEELIDTRQFTIGDPRENTFGKYIRTMERNKIVYEGPDKTDPSLWKIRSAPLADLIPEGPADSAKAIAIIAYPYGLDIVSVNAFGFDRGKYMAGEIKKSGFKTVPITINKTLADQYKYIMRYNIDQKRVETNFFMGDSNNPIDYTEQYKELQGPLNTNGYFPHDLSGNIGEKLVARFIKDNYRVLNLTLSRDDLTGKSLSDIQALVHDKYRIDKILFVPVTAYTKWVQDLGTRIEYQIGLLLCYSAVIFESGKTEPIFTYSENIDIGDTTYGFLGFKDKRIYGSRINFHSEDWSEDRKIHPDRPIKFYKDGVIDDTFAAGEALGRFEGKRVVLLREMKSVFIGGLLYEKLEGAGFLTLSLECRGTKPINFVTMPIQNVKKPGAQKGAQERDLDSYYKELGIDRPVKSR